MLKFILRLNAVSGYVAGAMLWVLSLLIVSDIGLRLVGTPILWSNEISVYVLISLVFLGAGYTYDNDGHFAIGLLVEKLPRKTRLGLELAVVVLSLGFALLLAWGGIQLVQFAHSMTMRSPTLLHTPLAIPYAAIFIGGLSLSLSLIARVVLVVTALREGKDLAMRTEHSI
jgi:TRAP-type C4-dicarboxylate transport system permease small subunit